jgi:Zn-dependent M16 (insulinase) family peptidase
MATLGMALVKIASQVSKTKGLNSTGEGIKAVALLLEEVAVNAILEKIAKDIMTKLSTDMDRMESAAKLMEQSVDSNANTGKKMETDWTGIRDALDNTSKRIEDMSSALASRIQTTCAGDDGEG